MKYLRNRYNDLFSFTIDDSGDVLWEGNFEYCRIAWPNVYDDAYDSYCSDASSDDRLTFGEFKENIHKGEELNAYRPLVYSDTNSISMVDPSGGPYIEEGMKLNFLGEEFAGKVVKEFKNIETGYKIIIKR